MRRRFLGMMALAGLSSGLALEASAEARAEEPVRHFVLENTRIIPIRSKYTGRRHELIVTLPGSWGKDPHKTYPVLYYLDAYWDTPQLVSTYGNLIYDNFTPEFIMVGLSYPKGANYDIERRIDYTVTASGKDSGGGSAFLDFITKEAAPLVETRFGGSKANRVISGNSLGGLFSLTAAYQAPGFFAGHVAVSPAASWDDGALARLDEAYSRTHRALPARMFIYMDASRLQGIFSAVQTRKVAVLYPALYAATPLAPMKSADPRLILLTGC